MMGYGRFSVKVAVLNVFELTFLEFNETIVYIMIESKPQFLDLLPDSSLKERKHLL